jgi:signal peptidase II
MMKRKYWILLITLLVILLLDQWTKYEVEKRLPYRQTIELIPYFFNLTHVRNPGGAFGLFGSKRGGTGTFVFIFFSLFAIGILLYFFLKLRNEKPLAFALSLVLGGAIGNLIDRFRYGEVIDFLDFHLFSYHWPAFNMADSAITIGLGLLAWRLWIEDRKRLKRRA